MSKEPVLPQYIDCVICGGELKYYSNNYWFDKRKEEICRARSYYCVKCDLHIRLKIKVQEEHYDIIPKSTMKQIKQVILDWEKEKSKK